MCSFDFEKKKIAYVICFQDEIAVNCEIFVKRSNFNVNVVQCDFPLQFSFLFFFCAKLNFQVAPIERSTMSLKSHLQRLLKMLWS